MARRFIVAIALLSMTLVPASGATAQDIFDPQSGGSSLFSVAQHPDLGNILADVSGRTLYRWDGDAAFNPPACNDNCANAWPPYQLDPSMVNLYDPSQRDNTDRDPTRRVSGVLRNDGTYQVAVDGWPLYYFRADTEGSALGNGSNGFGARWSVLTVDDLMMGM